MLETLQPASLNAIKADGWEEFEMAVDSGASETVVGEEMVVTASMRESEGSRRGVESKVANGESIPNLGGEGVCRADRGRRQQEHQGASVLCTTGPA